MRARKIKKERWVKFTKMGEKLGGCSRPGGLKNKKNIKNLLLQVPPQKCYIAMVVPKYLIYCNIVTYCNKYVHSLILNKVDLNE